MNKKEVRAKYIKGLVEDKENLVKVLEESTKESLNALVDESVNRNIRAILSESDDDSYEEKDVNPDEENPIDPNSEDGDMPAVDDGVTENPEGGEPEGEATGDGEEVWKRAEKWKNEDGDYDMMGKDIEDVIELIRNADEGDKVCIVKNSDTSATVEVIPDSESEEFEINLTDGGDTEPQPDSFEETGDNAETEGGDGMTGTADGEGTMDDIDLGSLEGGDGEDEGNTFEIEMDDDNENNDKDEMVNEGNVNLGYTDNYQSKTAMTMPHDKGAGEGDSKFDQGAPTGDGKRWVGTDGANGGNPYTQKTKQPMTEEADECNGSNCEECGTIFEVVIDDGEMGDDDAMLEGASTITRNNAYVNTTGMNQIHSPEQDDKVRDGRREASQKRGTGYGRGTMNESKRIAAISRQANAVLAENKELREIANEIKEKLSEAVVINSSLAKVIKLITENVTSRNEKINILNRFDKVHSLKESNELYKQISAELNGGVRRDNSKLISSQIAEGKNNNSNMIVETKMLENSSEIQTVLDFQKRLEKIK